MKTNTIISSLAAVALALTITACSKSTPEAPNASATEPFNDGIAAVKKFIADKNYQGALDQLNKLSSLKLSDEQTKVVAGLKTEVQALIAKGSAGAVDAAKSLFGK